MKQGRGEAREGRKGGETKGAGEGGGGGGAGKIELGRDGAYGIRKVVRILESKPYRQSSRQSVSPPVSSVAESEPSSSMALDWLERLRYVAATPPQQLRPRLPTV